MILIRCCLRSFFRVRPPGESRGSAAATPARGGFRFALLLATLGIFGAAASAAEFTLQWNDNSGNEEGFQVERALGTSGTFNVIAKVGANVTSYRDANLEPATQYRYRVRAFNTAGSSAYSNTASDTTKSTSSNDVITVNTPPAITAINAQTATSGSKKSVTFTLSDATNTRVIVTGGLVRRQERSLVGADAERTHHQYHVDTAFVGAAALAAVALPDTGWSPVLFAGLAAVYLAGAGVYARGPRTPVEVDATPVGVTS